MAEHEESPGDDGAFAEEEARWLTKQALMWGATALAVLVWFGFTWWRVFHAEYWDFQTLEADGTSAQGWVVGHGEEPAGRSRHPTYDLEALIGGRVVTRHWEHFMSAEDAGAPGGCLRRGGRERRLHPRPGLSPEDTKAEADSMCASDGHLYEPWMIEVLYIPEAPEAFMPAEGPMHVWPYLVATLPPSALVFAGIWLVVGTMRDEEDGGDEDDEDPV